MEIERLYRMVRDGFEYCFNIEVSEPLDQKEMAILVWLLRETFEPNMFGPSSFLTGDIIEVGPRLNFATAWNTNARAILRACGITKVIRIERSRRYVTLADVPHDRMTECVYPGPLKSFGTGGVPEAVFEIPLKEKGPDILAEYGINDAEERQFYYDYFVGFEGRNPTNVEIADLANANSEHSRHGFFRGIQIIDGVKMPETLMEIVKSTLDASPSNSVLAFRDNSSVIRGIAEVMMIGPEYSGYSSPFNAKRMTYDILFTAETHNFPSGIAPFPGAETGAGGRIRDVQATGRGGLVVAGTAAYCVGNLRIPGYELPWEDRGYLYPANMAKPLDILVQASNGASDYGNKFGEPLIQGFVRSFGLKLDDKRREWIKPIMFTGGIGYINPRHLEKQEAEKGMTIVQAGGPAYLIGMGGGAASSYIQGENKEELDFNAVQRGDAEMEQKMNRVIRACIEMGDDNPISSIHDQGAGGPANVLKELVEKAGGWIDIRQVTLGDDTLSVLGMYVAEFQERNGFLIRPEKLGIFKAVCEREKVTCEVLGEVTGDGYFTVYDSSDGSTPVHMNLSKVLGGLPQKTYKHSTPPKLGETLQLPKLRVIDALERVLRLSSVGSKRFLTNKVDRSVTGLIVQQQCCGPLQLTVADVAVVAQSHFDIVGAATAIGEQPIKMLLDPAAGARMTVAEMLTNIVWALIPGIGFIKCSLNWMGAPKLPGEGAQMYRAAQATRDIMVSLGIAVDGGKDSLSMATKVKESGETVVSPLQMVVSGYAPMTDIRKVVTPDIKRPGRSHILNIDLSGGRRRLGGSALAQAYGQIGEECPDIHDPELLKRAFEAIQWLIERNLILSGHDVSDGGLVTALLEMAFAGNCGLDVHIPQIGDEDVMAAMFAEEAGLLIEVATENFEKVRSCLKKKKIPYTNIGSPLEDEMVTISFDGRIDFGLYHKMADLRQIWEETSHQLERLQCDPECAVEERTNIYDRLGPQYVVPFEPEPTSKAIMDSAKKLKVAIIREEGSNGDREMISAFFAAGFEPWDVTMTDLLSGSINLDMFRGVVFVGGFSYADVLDSAKGWAAAIRFNPELKGMFDRFYERPDTFSLGVCNGCQLMALLGWVPFKDLPDCDQPRFTHNKSGRFESRWSTVKIFDSPAIMLKGMAGSSLGVWVAHGEGKLHFPNKAVRDIVLDDGCAPIVFVDDDNEPTEQYPFNPNGSSFGTTALCSRDGRHLAMMPHPERAFLMWQWPYVPENMKNLSVSPWLRMFQNARGWCENMDIKKSHP